MNARRSLALVYAFVLAAVAALLIASGSNAALRPAAQVEVERLAGGPVFVQCGEPYPAWATVAFGSGAAGVTSPIDRHIVLNDQVCRDLNRAASPWWQRHRLRRHSWDRSDAGFALLVAAHEAMHVAYPENGEAQTECLAITHVRPLARRLGIDARTASKVYRQAQRSHSDVQAWRPEYEADC